MQVESKDFPIPDMKSKKRKLETNSKHSTKMFHIQKITKDIITDLQVRSVTTPLTRYGCHNLSYLSLNLQNHIAHRHAAVT